MANIGAMVAATKDRVGLRPSLPLGQAISLGMIGYLEDDIFRYLGSTETMLGLQSGNPIPGEGLPDVEIVSGKEVSLDFRADAKSSPTFGDLVAADGSVEISFGSEQSFLISAKNISIVTMEDPILLVVEVLKRFKEGAWRKEWCFIHQVGTAASYTAVLSLRAESKLLLGAKAGLGPTVTVGDIAAGANYKSYTGALDRVVCASQVPAFFSAYRVKKRLFTAPKVKTASSIGPNASPEEIKSKLEFDDDPFETV